MYFKDRSTPYSLSWSILATALPYLGEQRECGLCNEEAMRILFANYTLLNTIWILCGQLEREGIQIFHLIFQLVHPIMATRNKRAWKDEFVKYGFTKVVEKGIVKAQCINFGVYAA